MTMHMVEGLARVLTIIPACDSPVAIMSVETAESQKFCDLIPTAWI